jgi:hypothetical protein
MIPLDGVRPAQPEPQSAFILSLTKDAPVPATVGSENLGARGDWRASVRGALLEEVSP